MKKILTLSIFLCMALVLSAVPARPGKFPYTQPDGTVITIEIHGDEFYNWVTDGDGNTVAMDADGYYRPVTVAPEKRRAAQAAADDRRQAAQALQAAARNAHIATGTKHFLVVLIEFTDRHFVISNPQTAFSNLLNKAGYSQNGATGSARDYYYENSNGSFEPIFDVVGPVEVLHECSYYGADSSTNSPGSDVRPGQALYEACNKLNSSVDFSQYDNDGDGNVDLVFFYYAGFNQAEGASSDTIWPHMSALYGYNARYDGVRVYNYACTSELRGTYGSSMCGIGTACHEFGHAMGLPDMYDTNYSTDGSAGALYSYSIMCSGSYNNNGRTPPYFNMQERIFLGWNTEEDIRDFTEGSVTIPAVNGATVEVYKSPTTTEGEYFMYECRARSGWDAGLPGAGLLVYHIDKSARRVGYYSAANHWNWQTYGNTLNAYGSHPLCYLIPAASQSDLNYGGYESAIPFPYVAGSRKIDTYTPIDWEGEESSVTFDHIAYSSSAKTITMTANVPPDDISLLGFNFIKNPGNGSYAKRDKFYLELVTAESNPPSSVAWYYDNSRQTGSSVTLSTTGKHTIKAVLSYANGTSETITLEITVK